MSEAAAAEASRVPVVSILGARPSVTANLRLYRRLIIQKHSALHPTVSDEIRSAAIATFEEFCSTRCTPSKSDCIGR